MGPRRSSRAYEDCRLTVGATQGFLYLRGEYEFIAPAPARGAWPTHAPKACSAVTMAGSGQAFDIALHLGAGAAFCGEETALIESVEGNAASPAPARPSLSTVATWACPPSTTTSKPSCR